MSASAQVSPRRTAERPAVSRESPAAAPLPHAASLATQPPQPHAAPQARPRPPSGTFNRFLAEQRALLVNFLSRRTMSREDAEDAAQESLARLLRYQRLRPTLWKPLLFRIARNVAVDEARRAQTHRVAQHEELTEAFDDIASDVALPDRRVDAEQRLARLRTLILGLPPRCQEVFLLNRIQGMSFVEIARHLRISSRAVEKSVARALKLLRQGMGEGADGPF